MEEGRAEGGSVGYGQEYKKIEFRGRGEGADPAWIWVLISVLGIVVAVLGALADSKVWTFIGLGVLVSSFFVGVILKWLSDRQKRRIGYGFEGPRGG